MWPFGEDNDLLQEKILAKNIIQNLTNELDCKQMSKEKEERKLIILQSIKYYYGL